MRMHAHTGTYTHANTCMYVRTHTRARAPTHTPVRTFLRQHKFMHSVKCLQPFLQAFAKPFVVRLLLQVGLCKGLAKWPELTDDWLVSLADFIRALPLVTVRHVSLQKVEAETHPRG